MANAIDSLVVTLGLDAAPFARGQEQAIAALTKTKTAAVKTGADIEKAGESAADAIHGITRAALAMFAVFTGFNSIKDFVSQITAADAALGRLALSIGETPRAIGELTAAVQRQGGSADGAAASLQAYSDAIQELKTTGTTGILTTLYRIQGLGGHTINFKAPDKGFRDLAENLAAIAKRDRPLADYLGRQALGNPDLVRLAEGGGAAVDAARAESDRHGVASPADIKAAQDLQKAYISLQQSLTEVGRTITTDVSPYITTLLTQLDEWIDKNKDWLATQFAEKIKQLGEWLKTVDWSAVIKGAEDFAAAVRALLEGFDAVSKKLTGQGGLTTAFEAFGVLLAAKVLTPLLAIVGLLTRLGGLSLPGWLMSALGSPFAIAAGILGASTSPANAGEPQIGPDGYITYPDGHRERARQWDGSTGHGAQVRDRASHGQIDDRNLWQRHMPTWAGGKAAPTVAKGALAANQKTAYDALKGMGLSDSAARAMVANVSGESLRNPADYHWDSTHMAQGIVQWDPERSAAIKRQFGKEPKDMSVAEQMQAAKWEIDNNPRFAASKRALASGASPEEILGTLVRNYEAPRDVGGATNTRLGMLAGINKSIPVGGAPKGGVTIVQGIPEPGHIERPVTPTPYGTLRPFPGGGDNDPLAAQMKKFYQTNGGAIPGSAGVVPQGLTGAGAAAQGANVSSSVDRSVTNNVNQSSVVNATVNTSSADASGIARDIGPHIQKTAFATMADYGPA